MSEVRLTIRDGQRVKSGRVERELARAVVAALTAEPETLDELEIESGWDLTGLYRGTPLPERSVMDSGREPDLVFLYREPILLEWIETGVDLFALVRNVVVHEIAHHFGFSDAEIAAIESELD